MSGYLLWADASGHLQRSEVPEHSLTIGTFATCGAMVSHTDVGPVHAALERDARGCRVRRLSRTRPLLINGKATDEKRLTHGDTVALGGYEARYADAEALAPVTLILTFERDADETPVEVELPLSLSTVGRIDGEVCVDDGGVSSRHLGIENFGADLCFVRDLGSTNGSELNGAPMGDVRHPLQAGDVITLGRVRVTASFGEAPTRGALATPPRTVVFTADRASA